MSTYCNEVHSAAPTKNAIAKECSGANSSDEGNISSEEEFRGFEQLPRVSLKRFDITQYLDGFKLKLNNDKQKVPPKKLTQSCTVHLVRDDLDKLKDMYTQNLLLNRQNLAGKPDMKLKCKICEKAYSSEKKLQNHQENKHLLVYKPHLKPPKRVSFSDHVIVHEVKEYHRCRKCPKIFENYTALKVHMKRRHRKRKCYICNYCSKKFVDRMFFKVHIKSHCDVCGQITLNKRELMEHRRYVCNVVKKYTCKTCDEWYFRFMDLKDHSYDHLGTFFICDICKDQFQTKCEVAHHIKYLHSKRRPENLYDVLTLGKERLYVCTFCEESSVDREIIENHVSSLPDLTNKATTGYKDFYFCDQCLKKFATEKEMLKHKWSHFLTSPDNSQNRTMPKSKKLDRRFNVNEKIPEYMQPKLVLEKLRIGGKVVEEPLKFVKVNSVDLVNGEIKRAVVDPYSKKTIISKHQCPICNKYFSSNYCLNRHKAKIHSAYSETHCPVCDDKLVWPSLLCTNKCLQQTNPELPFDDARAEIQFDNGLTNHYMDDFNIEDNYMNSLDFEIPAPIVELTEFENYSIVVSDRGPNPKIICDPLPNYKIVMQEVPIEY